MSGHGYEIVEDLLLNAERRAMQDRYDDAVGRLYRAWNCWYKFACFKPTTLKRVM
jgi:hypothetical protein